MKPGRRHSDDILGELTGNILAITHHITPIYSTDTDRVMVEPLDRYTRWIYTTWFMRSARCNKCFKPVSHHYLMYFYNDPIG